MNVDELPDDVDKRLQKSLQHYMKEVFRVNGSSTPVNTLNQEVYRETTLNFDGWLQKQVSTTAAKRPTFSNNIQDPLFENVGNRFEREQQSRAPAPIQPMTSVDFTLPKEEEDNEDPLDKYERLRKQRELESKQSNNIVKARASDQYSEPSGPSATTLIPPVQQNNLPPPALLAPRPQEYIIKQEDVVKYKENEINLFIYSGDRDWLANRNENRYNFTINFNPASNSSSATYSPSIKERFKNIVRMELVKAILSSEPLEVSVKLTSGGQNDTSRVINLLSYPYVMIRISEWTSNGFGTNANIDNTFGLVQYDQTWKSDNSAPNFGYISMTPRYLKSQRVYAPTPLATIQKLSFQVERPDGNPLTLMLDTLDISNIYFASNVSAATRNGSIYVTAPDNNSYIFIKTKTWFSRFFVNEGDRIQIRGYDVGTSTNLISAYQNDFNNFINSPDGHIIVGTAYSNSTSLPDALSDNYNSVGYSNYIVIRSRFNDPSTGSTSRSYFGGNETTEGHIGSQLETNPLSTNCALLNTNRQSHFVLRIITREMDGSSNLRPDNS
jgi:hypothetical protein